MTEQYQGDDQDHPGVRKSFFDAVSVWEAHSKEHEFDSNPNHHCHEGAIDQIVALGRRALPLIMEYLDRHNDGDSDDVYPLLWPGVVRRIINDEISLPEAIRGRQEPIRRYLVGFLADAIKDDVER